MGNLNTELDNFFTNDLISFLSGLWRQARIYGRCRNNVIEPITLPVGVSLPQTPGSLLSAHISHQFALLPFKLTDFFFFLPKAKPLTSLADFHFIYADSLLVIALPEITVEKKKENAKKKKKKIWEEQMYYIVYVCIIIILSSSPS